MSKHIDGSYEIFMTNLSWVGDGGIYTNLDSYQRFPDLSLSVVAFCNTPPRSAPEFLDKVTATYVTAVKEAR